MTTIRLFAALKAAAGGLDLVEVEAATAAEVGAALTKRFGDTMARRLQVATLLVDGRPLKFDDVDVSLVGATEIVALPPFSGGA